MGPASAVEQVLRAEREWVLAHLRLDVRALDRLMAPEYAQIDDRGRLVSKKEQVLASFGSGERGWEEARSDEHDVRVYGNTAVVGRWQAKGTNAGRPFDYAARYVSVWVERDGRWRMVSDQSTPIT